MNNMPSRFIQRIGGRRAYRLFAMPLAVFLMSACLVGMPVWATVTQEKPPDEGRQPGPLAGINVDWGGYLRAIGTISWLDEDSIYQFADPDPYEDGQLEWRLKNRLDWGAHWSLQTHYELVALGGDTFENINDLSGAVPSALLQYLAPSVIVDDDRRLFDLTHVLTEKDRYLVYHRLDRLNLTYAADWGTVRLGRQALTWGDGLVFNPMDLFNPFSPTAVQRDYKTGDDMAHLQMPEGEAELQMLYLPRRDPESGDLEDDASSYALKYHTPVGAMEMDIMGARHYDDIIVGLGASGYLGEAAWRINTVYTHLSDDSRDDDFFQVVVNLDYAWMWGGKNVYGLVEFFYNGQGRTGQYERALTDVNLVERLLRGELFTIGRYYLAGQLQVELHPLVQLHTTAIANLSDPSGLLQPQVLWDVADSVQAIIGGQWYWGGGDSEYGGYDVTAGGTTVTLAPADRIYLWLTYYY